jgi:hypothetical protein
MRLKKIVFNDDSTYSLDLHDIKMRYPHCLHRCRMGLAMRVEKTPQYPYAITLGALPLTESHLVYQVESK